MQQTITITELLRNHKQVQTMVNNSSEPIAVISNSKIIFTVQQPLFNTQNKTKLKRVRFNSKATQNIKREDIYNNSWLDK
jgi:hypothetical protein